MRRQAPAPLSLASRIDRVKLLTLARDLQRRRARERQQLFVVEGVRTVEELLRSPITVHGVIVSPALTTPRGELLRAALAASGVPILEVDERDFASAASTESPQGVMAIAHIPERDLASLTLRSSARILVLDGIQDPGNVGTIVRTAAAFGVAATLAMPGTVDLWNGKVVRSAMGALFHHPALSCTWDELRRFLATSEIPLWGAAADGESLDAIEHATPPQLAIVVGNEGAGLSPEASSHLARKVAIRICPDVESLNVAVATGILLHHFRA
ncbi:MAG TPA: RNA methyltransferase [Gemmatimonadaceae bacterium]|nr:RNA methyltransferase [Gemmatimonadaceae bacterium]